MEITDGSAIELELKYCESCGELWLRAAGSNEAYCPPCVPKMAEFAVAPLRRKSKPRLPVARDLELQGVVDESFEEQTSGAWA